jgi:ATP:ADP antiporter, AAA family
MFEFIKKKLWGDLSAEEFKRFGMLSMTLLFIIGTYWLMRPLKDGIFIGIVGKHYLPWAKILSFGFILPVVVLYAKLVDLVKKQSLFYILCTGYAVLFAIIAYLLTDPTIGLSNTVASPKRILGWTTYLAIESFGSLLVSLFWSFVASNTETDSAKRGYGLIIFGAQIGAMSGPLLAMNAVKLGMPFLTLCVSFGLLMVPFLIRYFVKLYPTEGETAVTAKKKTSPVEGLKLIFTKSYLVGVLGISTLYEVVATIFDLQMKFLAADTFANNSEQVTAFLGMFGFATNATAFVLAFIGTSYFIRTFGLTFCLVVYPICVSVVVLNVWLYPVLWVVFASVVTIKAISYALNNPCKEIMYIPTSKDAKFKAKSVIDMFGGRTAKAAGSFAKASVAKMASAATYEALICLGIIGVWISAATFVGRRNKKLVETNQIIE